MHVCHRLSTSYYVQKISIYSFVNDQPTCPASLPLQIPMQLMLLDERTRHRRAHRKSKRGNPHAPETLHVGLQHPLVPPFGQPVNLIDRIADPANLLFRARQASKAPLQV